MNNIAIARETIKITSQGSYEISGKKIFLTSSDVCGVEVYSPDNGTEILSEDISDYFDGEMCGISVTTEDSFQAAGRFENPMVMNFANAHCAGGGFKLGANAQEEALCRCSTLYASISSRKAAEMYRYNNSHISSVESDYMLLSPEVCVFRDERCVLLEKPFNAAVITVPAPNRRGAAAFASHGTVSEAMLRRIRIMLRIAAKHGYKNLVLGAWGCGAFGNDPNDVSGFFRTVLIDEGYGKCFDSVCFAIYGGEDSVNYTAFRTAFR